MTPLQIYFMSRDVAYFSPSNINSSPTEFDAEVTRDDYRINETLLKV